MEINPPSAGAEHSQVARAAHHHRGRARVGVDGVAEGRSHGGAPGFDDDRNRVELPSNLGPSRMAVNTGAAVLLCERGMGCATCAPPRTVVGR